jgi:L-cysteine S-thiosulfotransferase
MNAIRTAAVIMSLWTGAATGGEVLSGYAFQSADTQALQDDPFANPGMLWVDAGRDLWQRNDATAEKPCAACHGPDGSELAGVAARYPAYDQRERRLVNLEQRINLCRSRYQDVAPLPYESEDLLSLTAFVAHQSNGTPVDASVDGEARPFFEAGRAYYSQRRGQLNLACRHCHEENSGRMLRGDRLSQGHGNGYPTYRLEWQTLGSLHRRLRFCDRGVRAAPHAFGSPEYVNLELFLAWRATGLKIESPAVRR